MLALEIILGDIKKSSNFVINSINRNSQVKTIIRHNNTLRRKIDSFRELLPRDFPPQNIDNLERHIGFVGYYAERNNYRMMRGNANDFLRDIEGIRSDIQTYFQNWVINIPSRDLENTVRDLISEAVYCYKFGAYRSAIVMVGVSIERLSRELYHRNTGRDSRSLSFADVIDKLERTGLPMNQRPMRPILEILRLYRNFCAHPSDFSTDRSTARALIELAIRLLTQYSN